MEDAEQNIRRRRFSFKAAIPKMREGRNSLTRRQDPRIQCADSGHNAPTAATTRRQRRSAIQPWWGCRPTSGYGDGMAAYLCHELCLVAHLPRAPMGACYLFCLHVMTNMHDNN